MYRAPTSLTAGVCLHSCRPLVEIRASGRCPVSKKSDGDTNFLYYGQHVGPEQGRQFSYYG